MKIRTDFVTNSSSSSFVIAFKSLTTIDQETIEKYPILQLFDVFVEQILMSGDEYGDTTEGEIVTDKEELDKYFIDGYGWSGHNTLESIFKDNDRCEYEYKECLKALDEGFKILFKHVGYYDDLRVNLFEILEDSDSFRIISKDN